MSDDITLFFSQLFESPLFSVTLTISAYVFGMWCRQRTKWSIMNPMLIAGSLVIGALLLLKIDYTTYMNGGAIINFFLYPVTVALAVPLYRQRALLAQNLFPILAGVFAGCVSGILIVAGSGLLLGVDSLLIKSMLPKSVTSPIAIELSSMIGGLRPLTNFAVMVTGMTGAIVGPALCRLTGVTDPLAAGVAMGTSSHAIGTARALDMGQVQGAFSGMSISVAGVVTVLLLPPLAGLFGLA